MKKYKLHVISNTHWDREWRHPFQRMRIDLVEMMNRLLALCENEPAFKHFHLDSQTILLEDYLEICPEKRALLEKHIRNGKILAGPWYTLPDLFLISAEATVRNLMLGHKVARGLGRVMKVGYTPCGYGQPSQLAQIYRGFGIDSLIFYRGIDAFGLKKWEYIFESPDGSRVLGLKLGLDQTRFNYRWLVYSATLMKAPGARHQILFHPSDPASANDGYDMVHTGYEKSYDNTLVAQGIVNARDNRTKDATTRHLAMMDGFDASYPHANSGYTVRDAKKLGVTDEIVHQNFPRFFEELRASVDWDKLQVWKGESRIPADHRKIGSIMNGVLSSRAYFKRKNHDTQILLEKYAEPTCAFAWLMGLEHVPGFLLQAWKHLSANHGHDTICGPSVDQVYTDACSRLDQSQQIAHYITNRRESAIVQKNTRRKNSQKDQLLTVFNTLPFDRNEVFEVYVEFPQDANVSDFAIRDCGGDEVAYRELSRERLYGVAENGDTGYPAYFVDRCRLQVEAPAIPALGFKTLRVVAGEKPAMAKDKNIATGPNRMENGFLKVSINANGTVDIRDKRTRKTYKGMNYFEDGGDAGDPWYFVRPLNDRIVTSLGCKAKVKLLENTPLAATYRVTVSMKVPAALDAGKNQRVQELKTVTCASFLTLTKTSKYLAIRTEIETPVEDHRLRAMFPTGIKTGHAVAESSFDVAKRPIPRNVDVTGWQDREIAIQPQQSFVDVTDGKAGVAFLNRGIREYATEEDSETVLGMTLLRGTRYPKVAGIPEGKAREDDPNQITCQCKGRFVADYAIYPHAGDWRKAKLYQESRRFNVGLRAAQVSPGVVVKRPEVSFLRIAPEDLVLSALKVSESDNSLIVRFFNPTGRAIKGTISTANELKRARLVNLNEEPLEPVELADAHIVKLDVGKKKIVTLELFVKKLR